MHQILYVSAATKMLSNEALTLLLRQARLNNAALDVTGMLLYREGDFMQVIEGETAVVNALYHKISMDPRHTSVTPILDQPIKQRSFADWSMAFKSVTNDAICALDGYKAFSECRFTDLPSDARTKAHRLLTTFQGM